MAEILLQIVRGAVALSCGAFAVLAATHWAVTQGHLSPFGAWARGIRRLAGPILAPTERRVIASGGDPRQAPYWLLGLGVFGGLLLISTTQWIIGYVTTASWAARSGPRGILAFLVASGCDLLSLALLIRVIGSWLGAGRYTGWMRPLYSITDWLVLPIQRRLPATGMLDFSPMVAWLVVLIARALLLRWL